MKIRIVVLAAAAVLASLLSSCSSQTDEDSDFIYCMNADKTGLYKTEYEYTGDDAFEMAENMLAELKKPSQNIEYISPIPENVEVQKCVLRGSILDIDFSSAYLEQENIDEKLMRAAVVQSLVRIEGINAISFTVNGQALQGPDGMPVGLMNGDDFVENTGSSLSAYQTDTLNLYFANKSGDRLVSEKQDVRYSSNVSKEKLIVEKLMQGPSDESLYPTINPSANLLSVTIKDRICYVNFDSTFLTGTYDVLPELTVYSIVNSLIEGTDAQWVQITINGESNAVYMDSVDLSQPLTENTELIAAEEKE